MRRIHARLNATAAEFDQHKLGPAGGILLLTLAEREPMRARDLADEMSRDKSQIARGVQSLERKGLVHRTDCPNDGRASLLVLSPEGRRTVATLENAVASALTDVLKPLSETDLEQLKVLLRKL